MKSLLTFLTMKTSGSSPTLEMENPRLRNARKGKTVRPHICFHSFTNIALAAALLALGTSRQTSPTNHIGLQPSFLSVFSSFPGLQMHQDIYLLFYMMMKSSSRFSFVFHIQTLMQLESRLLHHQPYLSVSVINKPVLMLLSPPFYFIYVLHTLSGS